MEVKGHQPDWFKSEVAQQKLLPKKGVFTYIKEGYQTPGKDCTLIPSWPEGKSGVTIGHGYDCKERSYKEIYSDLTAAGIPAETAKQFGECSGLEGAKAQAKAKELSKTVSITLQQDVALFNITYPRYEAAAIKDITKHGGNPSKMTPRTLEVAVDIVYNAGRFGPKMQAAFGQPDINAAVRKLISSLEIWKGHSKYRVKCRSEYLASEGK